VTIADTVQLLTVEEVGHRLSLSRSVVYRLMRDGEVEDVKIGRARRITAQSVSAYVDRMTADGTTRSPRGRRPR
jgi:excisionase family DNA binding protein